jgi:G3E family GTPase
LLASPLIGETAVLINEFGEVGIDHLLVRKVDENIVLLNSGCLCCTVRDDLVETLDDLSTRRNAGEFRFDRVVIETTGLADPTPIIHTLLTDPSLSPVFDLSGLVATIDTTHGEGQLEEHPEAVKQVAMADRLLMTKTDLADSDTRERLRERLRALSPSASIMQSTLESGPGPDELLDTKQFTDVGKHANVRRWLNEEAAADRGHAHSHDVNRHDSRISTFCISAQRPLDWAKLKDWLSLLIANRGEQILRLKGIINVEGHPKPVIIHGVQHVFYPPTELDAWPDDDHRSRIVFITRDLPRSGVENAFRLISPA